MIRDRLCLECLHHHPDAACPGKATLWDYIGAEDPETETPAEALATGELEEASSIVQRLLHEEAAALEAVERRLEESRTRVRELTEARNRLRRNRKVLGDSLSPPRVNESQGNGHVAPEQLHH